jgi:hypothetical protein
VTGLAAVPPPQEHPVRLCAWRAPPEATPGRAVRNGAAASHAKTDSDRKSKREKEGYRDCVSGGGSTILSHGAQATGWESGRKGGRGGCGGCLRCQWRCRRGKREPAGGSILCRKRSLMQECVTKSGLGSTKQRGTHTVGQRWTETERLIVPWPRLAPARQALRLARRVPQEPTPERMVRAMTRAGQERREMTWADVDGKTLKGVGREWMQQNSRGLVKTTLAYVQQALARARKRERATETETETDRQTDKGKQRQRQ